MSDFSRLYISRKCGKSLPSDRKLSFLLPLVMIYLITAVLVFALVFISSVSGTIERMLEVLGRGSLFVYSDTPPDTALLPSGSEISPSAMMEGLLYSEESECAVMIHLTGSGYFDGLRGRELDVEMGSTNVLNPAVIPSSVAERLSLSTGDRMTLLVYEAEKRRTRPLLLTVSGIFPSLYPQLDSSLIYLPLESTGTEAEGYEILLPPGSDADNVQQTLFDAGYISDTYETMYSSIYVNAVSSIRALYAVFMVVALLAAYFASDAAEVYTQKDRRDIRTLMMLGASESLMRSVYLRLTMTGTLAASILGTVTGVVLGALSPYLFRILASCDPALLSYYVTSFTLSVPWTGILLMMVMMLLIASLSVFMTLRKVSRSESAG